MTKKKIDNRIRLMIENGVKTGHRTMFLIIGDKSRDQVPILYDILMKSTVKAKPKVLWCYKTKDSVISSHGKKRSKQFQSGKIDIAEADIFDAFRMSTTIHGRYYSETYAILGNTYGVCVLQDFEALTPNIIARTFETVEGGGLIILLIKTINSLRQIFTMSMDVHKRFVTEAYQDVKCRFNERLILSLANCKRCIVINDDLTVLPLSSQIINVQSINSDQIENSKNNQLLQDMKRNLKETPIAGALVNLCKTFDQAKAVAQFIEALAEKKLKPPTTLTAARGRGKSAALGLCVAAAVSFGYVNIFITSPHPENLITLFEFLLKGFDALEYHEHTDYTIIRSTNPDFRKAIIRINITQQNRQTIQYISPNDSVMLNSADLLMIDEAAAIPLPIIKKMLGPYIVIMASTINGYEGTGRSLSLKLISQLQKDNNAPPPIKLEESIRYSMNDDVENWLISLLCLDSTEISDISSGCPSPELCELYYVDRDALFSYHKAAEIFLHQMVSIYVSSHYKNSPNDLQMMSDAPAHKLFCLLGPIKKKDQLPEILVVIQAALEGKISLESIGDSMARGKKAAGDLIPWNVSEQFGDKEFPQLSGLRIIRIATHPNYQRMGYGKRALTLLRDYYEGKIFNLSGNDDQENSNNMDQVEENEDDSFDVDLLKEIVKPRKYVPTLLKRLTERKPERINYIGTSFGITQELLKFWKSQQFVPVYLSQKINELTGEYSCIMLSYIQSGQLKKINPNWLSMYFNDFRRRFLKLSSNVFRDFSINVALSILDNKSVSIDFLQEIDSNFLDILFLPHDLQRLESYSRNQVDYRLIADLTTDVAEMYFHGKVKNLQIDALQKAILLGIGIQGKSVDNISTELKLPSNQILAKFNDSIKKLTKFIFSIIENNIESNTIVNEKPLQLSTIKESLNDELDMAVKSLEIKQKKELKKLKRDRLKNDEFEKKEEEIIDVKSNNFRENPKKKKKIWKND